MSRSKRNDTENEMQIAFLFDLTGCAVWHAIYRRSRMQLCSTTASATFLIHTFRASQTTWRYIAVFREIRRICRVTDDFGRRSR